MILLLYLHTVNTFTAMPAMLLEQMQDTVATQRQKVMLSTKVTEWLQCDGSWSLLLVNKQKKKSKMATGYIYDATNTVQAVIAT